MAPTWNLQAAALFCRQLESVALNFGAHVALTGGCLYREGERKDADILIYRIRQSEKIDWAGLFRAWRQFGVRLVNDYGWCKKACLPSGHQIDFFDPDAAGEYGAYGDFEMVEP